jgi:lycopene beta-cyclase
MPAMVDYDLAIIGAGCAGLSLGARLAEQAPDLRVVLIDPRADYHDDRTFCFWSDGSAALDNLASARWPAWRFSQAGGATHVHTAPGIAYVMVRGADFYADARTRLSGTNVDLRLNTRATRLEETERGVLIHLNGANALKARHVVDTRPDRAAPALLHQVFLGLEIETDIDQFDPGVAGVMDGLTGAQDAVSFLYTLPLTPRRALVEWTRFAIRPTAPDTLRADLDAALTRNGVGRFTIMRQEGGVLPMGAVASPYSNSARIVKAGAGGGAVRAATGYAFQRIQRWADICAAQLAQGRGPTGHPREPVWRSAMDEVFLKALRADPQAGAGYFMSLARRMPADALVRFMSDTAGPADLARVVTALPPGPFLSALTAAPHRSADAIGEERFA